MLVDRILYLSSLTASFGRLAWVVEQQGRKNIGGQREWKSYSRSNAPRVLKVHSTVPVRAPLPTKLNMPSCSGLREASI
jgi:hypothetical protein